MRFFSRIYEHFIFSSGYKNRCPPVSALFRHFRFWCFLHPYKTLGLPLYVKYSRLLKNLRFGTNILSFGTNCVFFGTNCVRFGTKTTNFVASHLGVPDIQASGLKVTVLNRPVNFIHFDQATSGASCWFLVRNHTCFTFMGHVAHAKSPSQRHNQWLNTPITPFFSSHLSLCS